VARYLVRKTVGIDTAWLSIPESGKSGDAAFLSDKSKATAFPWWTAKLWAWGEYAELEAFCPIKP